MSAHIPVMLSEVLAALAPMDGEIYADGTFGAGGYTRAILDEADCNVIAIDRDETAIAQAKIMRDDFDGRLIPVKGTFGDIEEHLGRLDMHVLDGLVLDLGVSSMQIDQAERGFSFQKDGPLDMRMDQTTGTPAHVLVNEIDEEALADIIYRYGDERHSRKIAKAIVKARTEKQIETTLVLADIVASAMPGARKHKIHPATRTFQALRIAVNGELDQLEQVLGASLRVLKPGGRLVIVTFHSLEDTFVKTFFRAQAGGKKSVSRHVPDIPGDDAPVYFQQKTKKAIAASEKECTTNVRARSAKLRWGIRTDIPAPLSEAA